MAKISDHFSDRDFVCRCKQCQNEFRISLTLVGVLEYLRSHFNKRLNIINGYRCAEEVERLANLRKSYHGRGKAVDINVSQVPLEEVFLFAETIPQINGLGFYPDKKYIHLDVREKEKEEKWVFDTDYRELTAELRQKYNLIPKEN